MNTKIAKWTYNEFITFLLIHASYADLEFTEPERQAILMLVSQEMFDEIYAYYNILGEYEKLEVIMTCKDRFILSQDDKLKICLLYTSPSPRDRQKSRMPSSA